MQGLQNFRLGLFQESRSKLMQQTPDIFGGIGENLGKCGIPFGMQLDMFERLLQRTGNFRQGHKTDRGRTPRQGMRQSDG